MCNICLLTSSWTIFGIVFLLRTLFCIFLPYLDFWGPLFTKGNCVQKLIFLASAPVFSNVIEYIFYELRAKQITWSMWRNCFCHLRTYGILPEYAVVRSVQSSLCSVECLPVIVILYEVTPSMLWRVTVTVFYKLLWCLLSSTQACSEAALGKYGGGVTGAAASEILFIKNHEYWALPSPIQSCPVSV